MLSRVISPYKSKFRVCDSVKLENGVTVPIIKGQLSEVETISPNGYRYRKSFWETVLAAESVKQMIKNREMLGCEEHPVPDNEYLKTPYGKATHVVMSVTLRGSNPHGEFAILNNTNGNNIKALVDVGVPLGVSTRGLGDELSDEISNYIDETNYTIITWDIVNNPNFASLRMNQISDSMRQLPLFKELSEMYGLRDGATDDFSKTNLKEDMSLVIKTLQKVMARL